MTRTHFFWPTYDVSVVKLNAYYPLCHLSSLGGNYDHKVFRSFTFLWQCPSSKRCPYIHGRIENGYVNAVDNSEGGVSTTDCNSGYRIYGGDYRRTCLGTGEWTGQAPSCVKIQGNYYY